MVKAGDAVDQQIAALTPLLAKGDLLMDGGNANYRDTRRRDSALTEQGLRFLGVGVSGGEEGARHGPSIMAGGSAEGFAAVGDILRAIAAVAAGTPCCAHLGPDGAGHFVKTLHNGIEYADMQMIAEVYQLMRHGLSLSAQQVGETFRHWNNGPLSSYLVEITADIAATIDPDTKCRGCTCQTSTSERDTAITGSQVGIIKANTDYIRSFTYCTATRYIITTT